MLKTEGIPIWVTIFALLVFLSGAMASIAILNGTHGMDSGFALSWAGRNFGLGLIAALAVFLKSATAYLVAFIGGIFRETSDLVGELSKAEPNMGIIAFLVVFLVGGVIGVRVANNARTKR